MDDLGALWFEAMRGGRFDEAWALSARALATRDPASRDDPRLPYHRRWVWDGRAFDGADVLVRCYHGLGDTIQYARFLPAIARRAASVTLEVQPRLIGLLAQIPGIDRLIAFDPAHPAPPAGCDIEITELPFALRLGPDVVPAPYLAVTPAPLPSGTTGLCYAAGDWDPARSIPPAMLAPLCARITALSLVSEPTTLRVLNPAGCPFDIDRTAALIAGADRIVTVDTMIAHLAGALGRPTWLLLKAEPDWRWNPDAPGSVWYPTIRIRAQSSAGDWAPVIQGLAGEFAASDRARVGGSSG